MGYWLDVLAENPNLINPTLNNTGPFRWWIHESLLDNKPLDLFVTELVRLEGSERFGGPAGFGVASQNDVPMAAKGIILSSAFLGVEMKCARCHDAPTHTSKQKDLFELAAMLATKPIKLPATSSVAMDHLRVGGREPLIEVTLAPGTTVAPAWPFAEFCDETTAAALAEHPTDPRPPRRPAHRAAERALCPGDGQPDLAALHGARPRRRPRRLGKILPHAPRVAPLARPRIRPLRLRR
jgi:hypothetical protein